MLTWRYLTVNGAAAYFHAGFLSDRIGMTALVLVALYLIVVCWFGYAVLRVAGGADSRMENIGGQ